MCLSRKVYQSDLRVNAMSVITGQRLVACGLKRRVRMAIVVDRRGGAWLEEIMSLEARHPINVGELLHPEPHIHRIPC